MRDILNHLFEHKLLSKEEAKDVLKNIAKGQYNENEIAAFLTVYIMRSITVEELIGFRDALLDLCIRIDLPGYDTIDLCGTGGDGKDTFNISTLASFVVAGAGGKVVKHGNYGVSSTCGSSNVLEHLGYQFTNEADKLKRNLDKAGICFLHAPLFHPAMKNVGPVRRNMRVKTFFNMLGPMVNPCFPQKQIVGVFNLGVARLYSYLYQKTDKQFYILHSMDGYDEVSLTGKFKAISSGAEQLLAPEDFSLPTLNPEEIKGGDTVEDSAKIFMDVLEGKGTDAQNNVVIANAAMGLKCYHPSKSLPECADMARESLKSKKALNSLKNLLN